MNSTAQPCQIWEMQPYDTRTSYACFWRYYVNADEGKRGYLHAYNTFRKEHNKQPTKYLPGNWTLWSKGIKKNGERDFRRHTWAERYEAYQNYLAAAQRQALHEKILADAQAWAAEQELALERERVCADRLYALADQMLQGPVFRRTTKVSPNGQTQVFIEPAGWKLTDITTVLRLASDLNRRGLLMPRDGAVQEDSWRKTLIEMDLDPDDPESWLGFFDS